MDESLWLLGLLSAALPIVAVVASCIGYGVGSRVTVSRQRLWFHVKRLWDERDAAIRWADAWKATCADIDAERLAALARCADLEREISRLQAVVCEEDYKSIGRVLSGPSTVAAEAKAFIEQASAEVHEEAARLAAIDWDRVERALTEAKEATATLNEARKIDPEAWNKPMDL